MGNCCGGSFGGLCSDVSDDVMKLHFWC